MKWLENTFFKAFWVFGSLAILFLLGSYFTGAVWMKYVGGTLFFIMGGWAALLIAVAVFGKKGP